MCFAHILLNDHIKKNSVNSQKHSHNALAQFGCQRAHTSFIRSNHYKCVACSNRTKCHETKTQMINVSIEFLRIVFKNGTKLRKFEYNLSSKSKKTNIFPTLWFYLWSKIHGSNFITSRDSSAFNKINNIFFPSNLFCISLHL